uniref:Putative conserved plasma membrane protein n=1 Tax=Corethrella appendiculata TaxID=1370023 RepID=U5EUS4_9DIPT
MSFFQFRWLRRFVRRRTKPIPYDTADLWKRRLSIGYALIAWNAFGYICYLFYTGRGDWAKTYGLKTEMESKMTPAMQFSNLLKIDNARVIRFSSTLEKRADYELRKEIDGSITTITPGDQYESNKEKQNQS